MYVCLIKIGYTVRHCLCRRRCLLVTNCERPTDHSPLFLILCARSSLESEIVSCHHGLILISHNTCNSMILHEGLLVSRPIHIRFFNWLASGNKCPVAWLEDNTASIDRILAWFLWYLCTPSVTWVETVLLLDFLWLDYSIRNSTYFLSVLRTNSVRRDALPMFESPSVLINMMRKSTLHEFLNETVAFIWKERLLHVRVEGSCLF